MTAPPDDQADREEPTCAAPPPPVNWLYPAAIVAATIVSLWPVCLGQFINWDDRGQITRNPYFNPQVDWGHVGSYWLHWRSFIGSLYPVSYTFFAALADIRRLAAPGADGSTINPAVFHVASLALHVGCALLAFGLLRRLVRKDSAAFVGAMLFALHPMQVEAVAWVSGMNTLITAAFSLAALWAYMAAIGRRPATAIGAPATYASATLAYALALLSKPSAVVTPLLAAVLDRATMCRPWRRIALAMVTWLVLSVPVMLVTRSLQKADLVTPTPTWTRPIVALDAVGFYLYRLAMPLAPVVDHGRPPARVMAGSSVYLTCAVAIVTIATGLALRRRRPELLTGLALMIAGLVPVLGLTLFNGQTMSTVSDRFMYLSMIGPALFASSLVARRPRTWAMVAIVLLPAWGALSHGRAWEWRDEQTLFAAEIKRNPLSFPATGALGYAAAARGDHVAAERYFRQALLGKPDDPRHPYNLANALLRQRRFGESIPFYRRAIELQPDIADFHYNLGVALAQTGSREEARAAFEQALRLQPNHSLAPDALRRLGAATRPAATTTAAP